MLKKQKYIKHLWSNMKYYSKYEVALEILKKLNPDIETTPKNNYEVALAVLEAIKNGAGNKPNYFYIQNADTNSTTLKWVTDGTISPVFEYSRDGENWTSWNLQQLTIPAVSRIYLRGSNLHISTLSNNKNYFGIGHISAKKISIGGDLTTLLFYNKEINLPSVYNLSYLFNAGNNNNYFDTIENDFKIPTSFEQLVLDYIFQNAKVKTVPTPLTLDLSKAVSLYNSFALTNNWPGKLILNVDNNYTIHNTFYYSKAIEEIDLINCNKVTDARSAFNNCVSLKKITTLDFSNITDTIGLFNTFNGCSVLEDIVLSGSINVNVDFSSANLLKYDSVKSILTACAHKNNSNSRTLKFNRSITDVDGELAALVATCASKGWTISGLTLE